MDVSRIDAAFEQIGYSPIDLTGNKEADAMKFAEENNISVDEAKGIIDRTMQLAQDNKFANTSDLAADLNMPDEEEEIQIVDDLDFDNFLAQNNPMDKMNSIMEQNQNSSKLSQNNLFGSSDNFNAKPQENDKQTQSVQPSDTNNNIFAQDTNNIFKKRN